MNRIYFADNMTVLPALPDNSVDLIYIDPPFNTGRRQARTRLRTVRSADGDRNGFAGNRYASIKLGTRSFADTFDDYLAFLEPRLGEAHRLLAPHGSLYVHLDYREAHYVKVLLDAIFGRDGFLNEIIWAYDYGGRPKRRWPAKHDTILLYVKDRARYTFNLDAVERIPYMAPGLVGPEKAARGKTPTDCYSADTEILTSKGWIPFSDLRLIDEVATVAPSGLLEYRLPTKIHAYQYSGDMYHFATKTIDLMVTPNHKLYVRPKHGNDYRFVQADQANVAQYYSLRNHLVWVGKPVDRFSVPSVDYIRSDRARPLPNFDIGDWCEFIGIYLAEGSTTIRRSRAEVHIAQITINRRDLIRALLQRMRLVFQESKNGFTICNKQLTLYLKTFGHAHQKFIPRDLLDLPTPLLGRLYEGLMLGDGNKKGNDWIYVTTSPQLADDVQELLIKLGYMANIRVRASANPRWRPIYRVSRRVARESTIFPAIHTRITPYQGIVYCCTVDPYHTLVVRRNGKPAVCGNCWWMTIVPTSGKERTGYPTQKPLGILRRIIAASSAPGDLVLDCFAGSGTTGVACLELRRRFILVDDNPQALEVMRQRFTGTSGIEWIDQIQGAVHGMPER